MNTVTPPYFIEEVLNWSQGKETGAITNPGLSPCLIEIRDLLTTSEHDDDRDSRLQEVVRRITQLANGMNIAASVAYHAIPEGPIRDSALSHVALHMIDTDSNQAFSLIQNISDRYLRKTAAIQCLHRSDVADRLDAAFRAIENVIDEDYKVDLLGAVRSPLLSLHIPDHLIERAINAAGTIQDEDERNRVLVDLCNTCLSHPNDVARAIKAFNLITNTEYPEGLLYRTLSALRSVQYMRERFSFIGNISHLNSRLLALKEFVNDLHTPDQWTVPFTELLFVGDRQQYKVEFLREAVNYINSFPELVGPVINFLLMMSVQEIAICVSSISSEDDRNILLCQLASELAERNQLAQAIEVVNLITGTQRYHAAYHAVPEIINAIKRLHVPYDANQGLSLVIDTIRDPALRRFIKAEFMKSILGIDYTNAIETGLEIGAPPEDTAQEIVRDSLQTEDDAAAIALASPEQYASRFEVPPKHPLLRGRCSRTMR